MSTVAKKRVRELIESKDDLEALVEYAVDPDRIDFPLPTRIKKYNNEIESYEYNLKKIEKEIEKIKIKMDSAEGGLYNSYVEEYNNFVEKYKISHQILQDKINIYNQLIGKLHPQVICGIEGGIDLAPKNFSITKTATSLELDKFKGIAKKRHDSIGVRLMVLENGFVAEPKRVVQFIKVIYQN